jgi:anti-sigma regulatory factor (Ser/Thr protein kinase)
MSVVPVSAERRDGGSAFRHEAMFYASDEAFVDGTLAFIREGLEAGEPILVVVDRAKLDRLREGLGDDAAGEVRFADMGTVGANPARIIPAWRDFVSEHAVPGRPLRGIGEPISPSRSTAELVECHRHESLLNLAFADTPGFHLLCPYDTSALDPAVLDAAAANHPHIRQNGVARESARYAGLEPVAAPFTEPLPEPSVRPRELAFRRGSLRSVRAFVAGCASSAGFTPAKLGDLLLAATEIASNSVRHAGGEGRMRVWREGRVLICEVQDEGRIEQPLAGRERPSDGQIGGYGLWLANQLCDLVQVRSFPTGNVVRLHMRLE